MSLSVETELKLACDLSGLSALKAHPILVAAKVRPATSLRAAYFDAADQRLRKSGMSLRVRSEGRRIVQTLKSNDGVGLSRGEWESEVDTPDVDRRALKNTPAEKLLKSDAVGELFTVSVEREAFLVRHGASEIEVAIDDGRIAIPGKTATEAITEVELELKDGDAFDLFSLARELGSATPLRVSLKSKAERGYELANNVLGEVTKAEPVPLADDMTAAEALQAIVHSCLRHMRANETILLERRDAEALHQSRVAVRRLRSALSLFKPIIRDGSGEEMGRELKSLIEPLGRARDLDVLLSGTLLKERSRRPDESGLLNLEKRLETERHATYAAVDDRLKSQEWRAAILDLIEWVNAGSWLSTTRKKDFLRLTQPAESFARQALEKRRKQVKKRGANLDEISDEDRHRVGIAAKKLRYGSEFFATLYAGKKKAKRHAAFVSALKDMQDELGDLNDLATAGALVTALGETGGAGASSTFAAGVTSADLDRDGAELLKRARKAHDAFLDAKPFWR
jgi:triphosphatase